MTNNITSNLDKINLLLKELKKLDSSADNSILEDEEVDSRRIEQPPPPPNIIPIKRVPQADKKVKEEKARKDRNQKIIHDLIKKPKT